MKYGTMILRTNGSFDFYSRLSELHDRENIEVSYQYFQRQLKENGIFENDNLTVYRKPIVRKTANPHRET